MQNVKDQNVIHLIYSRTVIFEYIVILENNPSLILRELLNVEHYVTLAYIIIMMLLEYENVYATVTI